MRTFMTLSSMAIILAVAISCVGRQYQLDAHNLTSFEISEARVVFDNGKGFEWGVMDPDVEKGMYPMIGPLTEQAVVEWTDHEGGEHSCRVQVPLGRSVNSLKFIIRQDGTVKVEGSHE